MRLCRTALFAAVGVLAVAGPGGCADDPRQGYSFSNPSTREARSVQVLVFRNATSEPGHEALLTEAIIKELQTRGYRVVQGATADSVLAGTIRSTNLRKLSTDPETGLVQEMGLSMTIDFEWRDNRTNKVLAARQGFTASDSFVAARGGAEPIEAGQHSVYARLAKDLVGELRGAW